MESLGREMEIKDLEHIGNCPANIRNSTHYGCQNTFRNGLNVNVHEAVVSGHRDPLSPLKKGEPALPRDS